MVPYQNDTIAYQYDALGRPVELLDTELLGAEHGPFGTVDSLAAHVLALATR